MEQERTPETPHVFELSELYVRLLGSLGFYDASQDEYPTIYHPDDERWVRPGNA